MWGASGPEASAARRGGRVRLPHCARAGTRGGGRGRRGPPQGGKPPEDPRRAGAARREPGSGPGSVPPSCPPLPRGARPSPLLPSRWKVSRISSRRPLRFQHGGADGGGSRLQRGFLQGAGRGAAGGGSRARGAGVGGAGDPRGPRRGGGRRRGTAGPCCWRLPSARFNGLGARAPLCLETRRRAPAWLLPGGAPGRGLREAGGRAGAGAAGRGAGAPARPGRAGGADGGGQLTVTPGRPGLPGCSPPRPARGALPASPGSCCPGAPRTLGVRGESGQAAAAAPGPGACGLGSGRPLRRGEERVVEEEGFKGEARPGGRWEGRVSAQPSGKVAFVLSYFFSSSFPGVLFVSCERRPCIAVESGPGDGKSGVEEFVRDLQCKGWGPTKLITKPE